MTSKLSPQKLQQIQEQEIQGLLQAPAQFGTNKFLINVNGQSSKLPTNKNGIVKYTLEQPHKLEIGDRITLIESFVEERGLSIDTISFEEDVEEEMRFLYYQQGDLQNCISAKGSEPYTGVGADQKFAPLPNIMDTNLFPFGFRAGLSPNIEAGVNQDANAVLNDSVLNLLGLQTTMLPSLNYQPGIPAGNPTFLVPASGKQMSPEFLDNCGIGSNGQYYYAMEWFNPAVPGSDPSHALDANPLNTSNDPFKFFMRPLYGAATIKIPAGNYSVSALSDLINNQLNGFLTDNPNAPDGIQANALTNKLFNRTDNYGSQQTFPFFDGITADLTDKVIPATEFNPDASIIGADQFQAYQRRRGGVLAKLYFNPFLSGANYSLNRLHLVATAPADRDDESNAAVWAFPADAISNRLAIFPAEYQTPQDIAVTYDKTLFNTQSPNEIKFKRFQCNYFMNLAGLRLLFDNDSNSYYDQAVSTKTLAENVASFVTHKAPTMGDMLLAKLGLKGQYYFTRTPGRQQYNTNYGAWNLDRGVYRYADFDLKTIGTFQCLFPVSSSYDALNDPKTSQPDPLADAPSYQQYCGTSTFELSYDTTSANRFSIKNLHEPYKLSNVTPDATNETHMGGQQATKFNTPLLVLNDLKQAKDKDHPNDVYAFKSSRILANFAGQYPVDSNSGIAVNNFSFSTVKSTKVYKQLVEDIATLNTANVQSQLLREKKIYDLFTKPYDQFFESTSAAKEAWSKTLWSRIGFSYEQLGDVSSNLEKVFTFTNLPEDKLNPTPLLDAQGQDGLNQVNAFNTTANEFIPPKEEDIEFVKQMGIVSHNSFNFSFIPSSDGLGLGNVAPPGQVAPPQSYTLRGYTSRADEASIGTAKQSGVVQNNIHILTDSQPINASDFPSLNNGNNYLIIESDIVKRNAKDAKSNDTTIVGIMSKENASNDTIFSVNPVTFVVTEPKLLSTIEVRIKNPDGTLVSDDVVGKNNAFIFQIEKAIAPNAMTMEGF